MEQSDRSKSSSSRSPTVTIEFQLKLYKVQVCTNQFKELDEWARRRFGIMNTDVVVYLNQEGLEIVPGPLNDYIKIQAKPSAVSDSRAKMEEEFMPFSIISSSWWDHWIHVVPLLLMVLLAASMMPQWKHASEYLLQVQKSIPLDNMTGPWLEKAYIGFLSWSTTYLFIRRALNPETAVSAVKKYSADAIFGGFAAAGAVIIKAAVLK